MVKNTASANAASGMSNMTTNAASAVTNVTNNAASAITNVTKNAASAVTNAANSAVSAVTNVTKNAASAVANASANAVNTMANSFKSVQANTTNTVDTMANSIQESINAVPPTAPALSISLPLILGIGVLMIALALVLYYRSTIQSGIMKAYTSMKNMINPAQPAQPAQQTQQTQSNDTPSPATPNDMKTVNKMVPNRKTVFNVNSNKYKYSDAEPLCKALGAELATYDQVKQAWDQGADWCNYGWIKGQAAVYPTQKGTYDALQLSSVDDERMACGSIGVNGGYMDNPELRYGVNCYGDKPSKTAHDLKVTNELIQPPLTPSALKQKMVEQEFKANANLIGLLPFNETNW